MKDKEGHMKIVILSRNPKLYSTQRLVTVAKQRGHHVHVLDTLKCYMGVAYDKPTLHYKGREITDVDAVIPRIGASITQYGASVIRQFEMMSTYCLTDSLALTRSRDKLRSLQLLSRKNIGLPRTSFAYATDKTDDLIDLVGGAPLVVKLCSGTQGKGVVLAQTKKAAESVIDAFRELHADFVVQEFVKESRGSDIRCFVIDKKVVSAIRRTAPAGEFRSNLHRGGSAEVVKLTPAERRTAIDAAHAMGLNVAGVDILQSERGALVMEVNSSPGLEGIETATGIDVASQIIHYTEHHAKPYSKRGKRG